jgi:CelD/BcsL family acetyltransferase involved in cellulose biosynthesis/SAM-dependent methyltransferase
LSVPAFFQRWLGIGLLRTFVRELSAPADLRGARPPWDDLLGRAKGVSLTQTPAYVAEALAAALASGARAFLVTAVEADERWVGAWGFTLRREGLLQVLRPASCGSHEEYVAPLVEDGLAEPATRALLAAVLEIPADLLVMSAVARGGALDAAIQASDRRLRATGQIDGFAATLSRFPTWEAYLAQASKSHLYNQRRDEKKLRAQGRLEIGACVDAEDAARVLAWAWRNKQAWAKARRIDTPWLRDNRVRDFFIRLARQLDLSATPLVSFVKLNGEPIAANINFVGDRVFELYFTTFDPAQAHWSPGELLIHHSFEWAIAHGLDYDFRILAADYKSRLSDQVTTYVKYECALSRAGQALGPLQARLDHIARRARRAPGKAGAVARRLAGKVRRRAWTTVSDVMQRAEDRALGIDTHVPIPREPPDPAQIHSRYEPVRYDALRQIAARLPLGERDVLFDVGCGRGRILAFFGRSAVGRVVGVEFDPILADQARRNIERLRGRRARIEVITGDAAELDYDDATVLFLYNPFGEPVMGRFIRQVKASLARRPRDLRIVYCNPVCRSLFIDAGFGQASAAFEVPYGGGRCPVALWTVPARQSQPRAPYRAAAKRNARAAAKSPTSKYAVRT